MDRDQKKAIYDLVRHRDMLVAKFSMFYIPFYTVDSWKVQP